MIIYITIIVINLSLKQDKLLIEIFLDIINFLDVHNFVTQLYIGSESNVEKEGQDEVRKICCLFRVIFLCQNYTSYDHIIVHILLYWPYL